jgi:hypothetical protein
VLKLQDSTTNSTALSQEITKSEPVGQIRINPATGKPMYYKDNPETKKKENAKQMYVNGKYVPKSHPLYKAGRYKGFEDAAFSSLENFKDSPQGQVYIVTNPAWEGWVKVGMAVDAEDRLKNYQTSSPYRDYSLVYAIDTPDRRYTERMMHDILNGMMTLEKQNEWFKIEPEWVIKHLEEIVEYVQAS